MKPVVLIVMDGVGYNENPEGNAVVAACTPKLDYYRANYPRTLLDACGEAVGLPEGFQGSSEVGHLSMGAGRIVEQELKRINDKLIDGTLYATGQWQGMMTIWKSNQARFHLFGLLQDEGVHAHQDHLFKFMRQARLENPAGRIVIHPFLDGRDTPPRSTLEYFSYLRQVMAEVGNCTIGTIMGRYYGMDRARNWKITDQAYHCIVNGAGRRAANPEQAIEASYARDKTPSGVPMFDEYILPHTIGDYTGVMDGDVILHTNYRQDRAIQLTMAFVDPDYPGKLECKPLVTYVGLTRYYDEFDNFLLGGSDGGDEKLGNLAGEIISKAGLRQLRIAETQKFRHVTSFFNGKSTTPFPGEDQVDVPSRFDPASFALHPEMEAYNVTTELLQRLEDNPYSFILVNYANGDMVGHTGEFEAAKKAVEIVDENVGKIVDRILELGGKILLTADHGNSDQMIDYDTDQPRTSHSLNPVECFYIANDADQYIMKEHGILPSIGPTILKLMGLDIPAEMTASELLG
ncbi:MAG: 2,3-bisphosphoglycerate-independent phosphoglycerate mutase [Candidatus Marinimicrobia bacterium]|nr:2,3-bisphosphoglycerate-independent phosphoglycerate mutase [Candidatus Neomarinimicrobiota bacterium]